MSELCYFCKKEKVCWDVFGGKARCYQCFQDSPLVKESKKLVQKRHTAFIKGFVKKLKKLWT